MRVVLDAHPGAASVRDGWGRLPLMTALNPGEMRDDQDVMLRRGLGEKNGVAQVVQKGRMPPSLSFCKSEQLCTKGLAQGEIATVVSTPRNATPHPCPRTFSSDLAIAKE